MITATVDGQTFGGAGCSFRAFGDVNLGRQAGQQIFSGDTLYPFRNAGPLLTGADLVFVNLESPLTDQGGETRHPTDGYRFCGPPAGAMSLAMAGIDLVAGANNHAYDYGRRGLLETLSSLDRSAVDVVGLNEGAGSVQDPVILTANGLRIGVVAYTEFVNMSGMWSDKISVFARSRARKEIAELRKRSDIVIASYHGGTEYTPGPPTGTLRNLRALADAGADVVIGHHPHVPQGVEIYRGTIICYSLGNFVFYQPQRYWTQIGLAACLHIERTADNAEVDGLHLIPFRAGLQPHAGLTSQDLDSLEHRFNMASPSVLRRDGSSFIVSTYDHSFF